MRHFRQLAIGQRSHHLTLEIHTLTKRFPKDEQYGLTSRPRGSASGTDAHLNLAADLGHLGTHECRPSANEIHELKRMTGAFARKLKTDR